MPPLVLGGVRGGLVKLACTKIGDHGEIMRRFGYLTETGEIVKR